MNKNRNELLSWPVVGIKLEAFILILFLILVAIRDTSIGHLLGVDRSFVIDNETRWMGLVKIVLGYGMLHAMASLFFVSQSVASMIIVCNHAKALLRMLKASVTHQNAFMAHSTQAEILLLRNTMEESGDFEFAVNSATPHEGEVTSHRRRMISDLFYSGVCLSLAFVCLLLTTIPPESFLLALGLLFFRFLYFSMVRAYCQTCHASHTLSSQEAIDEIMSGDADWLKTYLYDVEKS